MKENITTEQFLKESKVIEQFLKDYTDNELTRKNYLCRLKMYYTTIGDYPDAYITDIERHKQDLRIFFDSEYYKKIPKLTVKTTLNAVVQLIGSNFDYDLPKSFKKMITNKTKKARPITVDKILNPSQLKDVISSGNDIERAMFSMLAGSGMRINEFSMLEIADIDLKTKPVTIHVRHETAKNQKERYCFIDSVARKYLDVYLAKRDHYFKKLDKYNYKREINKNLLFPITQHAIRRKWEKLLNRNGLLEKDEETGRNVYHIHTLRKRWKTIMTQHMADTLACGIIGHARYLGTYEIHEINALRDAYKECENYISFEPKIVDKAEFNGKMEKKDIEIAQITTEQQKQQQELEGYRELIEQQQRIINVLTAKVFDTSDKMRKAGLSKYVKQKDKSEEK